MKTPSKTLVELLEYRAEHQPNQTAYIYLRDANKDEDKITYAGLHQRAQKIAGQLREYCKPGDRVLINYLPGIDYIASFFGCLYAGAIAVPVYPPRFNQKLDRLNSIIKDVRPTVSLTSRALLESLSPLFEANPLLQSVRWLDTNDAENLQFPQWERPNTNSDSLAFIQYTSGSTSAPKGVMLSHSNLINNLESIYSCFGGGEAKAGCVWLPPYHDMGLIGGILEPIYAGFPVTLFSPYMFLQRPFRWLKAVSKYKAQISGAPNFAYDLCVRRVTEEQMQELDLSAWNVAFCGAEPVRPQVLERFAKKFAACGFQANSFYPCYGLAETTLMISGGQRSDQVAVYQLDDKILEKSGEAQPKKTGSLELKGLVSCGDAIPGHDIKIVDAETSQICEDGKVGEVWVNGPSVAQGYWEKPEVSQKTFHAKIQGDESNKDYLRTGDLGFYLDGHLFITGRIKDLMIIRGRNVYPQDIEQTVEDSHPAVKPGSGAAVAVHDDEEGVEKLVIIQEIDRSAKNVDLDQVVEAIKNRVFETHGLNTHAVSLIRANSIPVTSSGKIQRQSSKKMFLSQELKELKRFIEV